MRWMPRTAAWCGGSTSCRGLGRRFRRGRIPSIRSPAVRSGHRSPSMDPTACCRVPAGNPAPDFDSERRTGDNLYTDSVIAIDAATGRILGYNQLVKRDSHDWDVDSPPTLATTRSGKRIVASAHKDGLLSILDRSRVTRGATPADLTAVLPLLSQMPTTTRENVDAPLSRDHLVHFCPGIQGGVEWNGAAFSPHKFALR